MKTCFLISLSLGLCTISQAATIVLSEGLTFYASFDKGLNADFALGDKTLYGAAQRNKPKASQPGLPSGDAIQLATGKGRYGGALEFKKKSDAIVFFNGNKSVNYQLTNWNGSISCWLKLDPDEDLQPGYCDPLQIAAGNWSNGVFFAEFSKDNPRHFRFALRPLLPIWNPENKGWEAIPVAERPMVQVEKPPFGRDQWTHVAFTFENANTARKDGLCRLYLNGAPSGEFKNWDLSVKWDPEQILLSLGVSYVGLIDEVALFNRALSAKEVQIIYTSENGIKSILSR